MPGLVPEDVQSGLQFGAGVRIEGAVDAAAVPEASVVKAAQLFECLSAVEVSGRVGRVRGDDFFKLGHGVFELAGVLVFHGEAVAGEQAGGVLFEEVLEKVDAREFQVVRITFVSMGAWRARFSNPGGG